MVGVTNYKSFYGFEQLYGDFPDPRLSPPVVVVVFSIQILCDIALLDNLIKISTCSYITVSYTTFKIFNWLITLLLYLLGYKFINSAETLGKTN